MQKSAPFAETSGRKSPRRNVHDVLYVVTAGLHGMKQFRQMKNSEKRVEALFALDDMTVNLIIEPALDCVNRATRHLPVTKYFDIQRGNLLIPKFESGLSPAQFARQIEVAVEHEELTTFPAYAKIHTFVEHTDTGNHPCVEEFCGSDRFCKYTYQPHEYMSNKRIAIPHDFRINKFKRKVKRTKIHSKKGKRPSSFFQKFLSVKYKEDDDDDEVFEEDEFDEEEIFSSLTGIFAVNEVNGLWAGENLLFNSQLISFAERMNIAVDRDGMTKQDATSFVATLPDLEHMPTQEQLKMLDRAKEVNRFATYESPQGIVHYLSTVTRKTLFYFFQSIGIKEIVFVDATCDVFPCNVYPSVANEVCRLFDGNMQTSASYLTKIRKMLSQIDLLAKDIFLSQETLQNIIDQYIDTMVNEYQDEREKYDDVTTLEALRERIVAFETKIENTLSQCYQNVRDNPANAELCMHDELRKRHFKNTSGFGKGFYPGKVHPRGGKTRKSKKGISKKRRLKLSKLKERK